jgi:hypothetical protein
MECYNAYQQLQDMRETIDARLTDKKKKLSKTLQEGLLALRGEGAPENSDILYGSVIAKPMETETIVGLQEKFLHVLLYIQNAEARPTQAMTDGVTKLKATMDGIKKRFAALK